MKKYTDIQVIQVGDKVEVINVRAYSDNEYEHPKELIGMVGIVTDVDEDWEYPYTIYFGNWEEDAKLRIANGCLWIRENLKVL